MLPPEMMIFLENSMVKPMNTNSLGRKTQESWGFLGVKYAWGKILSKTFAWEYLR